MYIALHYSTLHCTTLHCTPHTPHTKMSVADLQYIDCETLHSWIYGHTPNTPAFQVVDVRGRDHDFQGHVPGSWHVPAATLLASDHTEALQTLHTRLTAQHTTTVVFHCQHSQQRGPRCALQYTRYCAALSAGVPGSAGSAGAAHPHITVCVLRGGFSRWHRLYG